MQVSHYSLRVSVALLLFSAVCLSTKGQQTTAANIAGKPATAENAGPEIPGYLATSSSSRRETRNQDVVLARPHLGKSFWIPWIANLALMVASVELTENCLHSHPTQCAEADPILGKSPTRAKAYAIRGGLFAACFLLARDAKLKGDGIWKFGTYTVMAGYSFDTAHDAYETAKHSGDAHSALVANAPASQVEIISTVPRRK